MATDLAAMSIDQLWQALQSNGYYTSSALNLPAANALGSAGIDALLGDATLFPGKALAMNLTGTQPPGSSIVLTGTLANAFLGQANAAAVATFTIDGTGLPALSLVVTTASGTVLATAFASLPADSAPADQAFSAASFTAGSGSPPTLQFSGTPDLSQTAYAKLWSGKTPSLAGTITDWSAAPSFQLATDYADASANPGILGLQIQMSLAAAGTTAGGQLQGKIISPGTKLDGLQPSCALPVPAGVPAVLDTGPLTNIGLPDLGTLSGLFLGQQLAALIPSQFSLGNTLFLGDVQLGLAPGAANLQTMQVTVNTGNALNWPLLPGGLLDLTQVAATFGWLGGTNVSITFGGDFQLGGNDQLGFTAAFTLPQQILSAQNDTKFDVGQLLSVFGIDPPHTGLYVDVLAGTLAIPTKTWSFTGDVTFDDSWSIKLMGETAIGMDAVSLAITQTSSSRTVAIAATATLFDAQFQVTAATDSSTNAWAFAGTLLTPLHLSSITKALLPFAFDPPDITVESLDVAFNSAGDMFSFDTVVDWKIDEIDTEITAELQLLRTAGQYSGFLKGEVDIHGLVLQVRYDFSPTSMGISFAYRSLTISYHKDASGPTVTISLGRGTVGDLFDFLLSFADPGRSVSLGSPWDAFEKIELPEISVTVNLNTKAIRVELDHVANLGFIDIQKIVLNYSRDYGTPRFNLELSGTFLGQPYGTGGNPPLRWDALNDPPPAVPGTGTQVLDLEFLGLGQRVAISGSVPTEMDKIVDALEAAMRPPADPNKNPVTQLDKIAYAAGSNWLIGTRFTVMSTLRMDIVFNDPVVYGVLIQLSGEKAGLFAGLRFEILYRKVTDTIGVYHIELTLPDEMRHLEFGEVSVTLPIVTIDIYTNGNFRVDLGYPPSLTDFSRSFSVQVFPFTGFGGLYFAVLDGQTSTNVPKVTSGHFGTVLEFGFALQVGVGKTLSLGILSGGISITVGGAVQGVLGWYTPNDSNLPSERYYHLTGTVALIGQVYATVDFGIIQASVSLTVYASISLDVESYKAILIEVSAGVSVKVSIKILFIRIHFSFNATITERFSIGSDSTPPWTLAAPGGGSTDTAALRGRRAYRSARPLLRQPPYALLRRRPARQLQLGRARLASSAASTISIPVLAIPIVTQALSQDFAFPSGPTVPSGTTTPVLGVLLGLQTSNDPTQGANPLMAFLLDWAIDAIGHEHDTASAAVIEEILQTLSDASACDTYFGYGTLTSLFQTNGVVFTVTPRPDSGSGSDELPAAVLAMIPELRLSTPDFTIDFTADRRVGSDYEQTIRDYFASLSAKFGSDAAPPQAADDATVESLATFVFRYQFYMLAKSVVQAARDLLGGSTLTLTAPASLAEVANLYNNNYTTRPGDTLASIAPMFGLTEPVLAAANPDLPAAGPSVGDAIFVPAQQVGYTSQANDTLAGLASCFGVTASALQAANPGVDFGTLAAGTAIAIPAMRVLHSVLTGETATSIAMDFAVDPAALAAANPGVDLTKLSVGQVLLIPRQLTPLAVAAANAGTPGLLDTATTITLANIQFTAASTDSPSSLAKQFGIQVTDFLTANTESVALLNPGQQIALGQLATTTRAEDSLDGLWAYWYGGQTITLTALSTANPTLTVTAGQKLAIPNGSDADQSYTTQGGDTFAGILGKYSGLTVEALIANNGPIRLDPAQAVTLPGVVHTTATSYQLAYTTTANDTYETIAAAFFAADDAAAAVLLLQQLNGTTEPSPGDTVKIPYASSIANLTRQYGVTIAALAGNAVMAQSSILAPRAPITIASTSHALTAADTLGGIAQNYDLSIEQLVDQLATVGNLFAATTIKIPAIPGMRIDLLAPALAASGGFTNALNMTSRFLTGGLRVPAPSFQTGTDTASVVASPAATAASATYPLYALVGQEFPVNPAATTSYEITITGSGASWVAPPAAPFPLDTDEVALITAFTTIEFDPGVTAGAAQMLTQFATVPDRQPPAALFWWQTPDLPALQSPAQVVQPSIWMMPAPLADALAASPSGMLAYAGYLGTTAADGTVSNAPLAASRFATVLDLTIEQVPGTVPGVYNMVGTDQAGLQRLIALWEHLQSASIDADLTIAYASQDANAPSGTLVSDALDRANSFLLKTNLSTETNAPPAMLGAEAVAPLNTAVAEASVASFSEADSRNFLQFLWECSAVRSGGFYLRYVSTAGKPGLPGTLFKDGKSAQIKLVVASADQPANVPIAMAFNNALIVGDNEDPAHQKLFFEAVCYTVAGGDTLSTAADNIAKAYPGLPSGFDWSALAAVNQLIPGTLIAGMSIAGQTATPDDSLLSLAERAQITVAALATQIKDVTCLRAGALLQLLGEPIQTIAEGDTLVSICQDHSYLDPASLAALNAATQNLLAFGQPISVPGQADRTIQQGDTFGSIATSAGLPVTVLGEANADAPILATGAGIVVAADTLRTVATLPPGRSGFALTRTNPEPAEAPAAPPVNPANDPQQALGQLYHMLGFEIVAGGGFDDSGEGLPATPADQDGDTDDTLWRYRQVLAVYPFAQTQPVAMPAALPAASDDPYAGIAAGAALSLQLAFQDVLGNRTSGSVLSGTGGPTLTGPVGYTDELVSLAAWPSLVTSYRFMPADPNLVVALGVSPTKFQPDATPAPMIAGAPDPAHSAAATRAGQARARYAQIHYQLLQPDIECALSTTLGPVADPTGLSDTTLATLRGVAASAYVYMGNAQALALTTAGPAQGFANLTALTTASTTTTGAGYPASFDDLAAVNANAEAALIFGDDVEIQVPVFKTTLAGETPAAYIARVGVSDTDAFAAANAEVALMPGAILNTSSRTISADDAVLSLAAMADALVCSIVDGPGSVPGLATANAKALLAQQTTLTIGNYSYTTGTSDTLESAATALGTLAGTTLTPADVAAANAYVAPLFASGASLSIASALAVAGDTLASFATSFGPPTPAELLQANLQVPGIWPGSTALFVENSQYAIVAGDTIASIASTANAAPGLILSNNAPAPLATSAALVIPWSADATGITAGTYAAPAGALLADIVEQFAGWSLTQLADGNLNWPGLFAATPITIGTHTVTPGLGDTFASLAAAFSLSPGDFANQVGTVPNIVRQGAVFVTPAWASLASETLGVLAQRYGTDPASLAAANATLPGLLTPGASFPLDGASVTIYANDSFALIAARVNAARTAAKLPPVSVGAIGTAAASVPLLARTLLGVPAPATIAAEVTPADAQPILSLAVDLAISRDPSLVAPAFAGAARVVSANAPIAAAPFAATEGQPQSLDQFAADFEAAFPGHKLATGPQHTHFSPVLSKPSLRAAAGGGSGATSSGSVRALWVVNLSATGITYRIDPAQARFFAVEPLSTYAFSADNVSVPTYSTGSGLGASTTMNFRGADPEEWNLAFLQAVDLVLSPAYAAAAQTDVQAAASLATLIAAKGDIAKGMAKLVASVVADQTEGLQDAIDTMTQRLLVELGSLYSTQALVQFGVDVGGSGANLPGTPPRLAGKLKANVVTTPGADAPVDPDHPFAALAAIAAVAPGYLAAAIADVADIVQAGVVTNYAGGNPRTTLAGDTLTTIAQYYAVAPELLATGLTIASDGPALFRAVTPVNVSAVTVPASLTRITAGADWLGTTVIDLLDANADRTDFFAPQSAVTIGNISYTPQPQDRLTDVAAKFGGMAALAQGMAEVDAGSTVGSYTLNSAAPPRALQALPQISLQSSKASLSQGSTLTTMLTVNRPAEQSKLVLDLDFMPNQLEFDIYGIAGVAGYEGSSWLSFVRPLDPAPNHIGQVAVPIALRGYPVPAVISGQQALPPGAGGAPDSTLTQWNYQFDAQRPFAAQDEMTLEITFNEATTISPAPRGSTDRSQVIAALAGFSAIWPAVSKDLAAVPLLLGSFTPDEQTAARNALAALAWVAGQVQLAWNAQLLFAPPPSLPTAFQYDLSTRTAADGKVDALVLDRVDQATDFSKDPDDFLFLTDTSYASELAQKQIPAGLTSDFAAHGFTLSGNAAVTLSPTPTSDWMIVDNGDPQLSIAPQTYRLLLADGTTTTLQVWRQLLWPALSLGTNTGPVALPCAQAGTRLTYSLTAAQEIAEGAPLDLQFCFYRLDAMTLSNAWGGFWISRNANLVDDVNQGLVYETPLTRFPTRITPYIQRPDPVALTGSSLEAALCTLFEKLFAGQAALTSAESQGRALRVPLPTIAGSTTRNIRVQAGYWRSPSGGDPVTDPLSYRNPLALVPIYAFDVATDWQPGSGSFCTNLATAMQQNATSLGIVAAPGDQWVIDVLIYGDGADDQQPLLFIANHYFPVAAGGG
ncbi:MAG: LysM domain-containing protein [Sphingomonas sp.]|uniref:LysM peptidoglycan-binding domain-containing protein n=1 Tax=Sphingomonas sp. TaxID=28214 RepID=UPI00227513C1|nr:LysM domain-containing protein [Sphingomonas sp.]MCX8477835.1 LysM domain-containing protein [Sphingomonas sp.]